MYFIIGAILLLLFGAIFFVYKLLGNEQTKKTIGGADEITEKVKIKKEHEEEEERREKAQDDENDNNNTQIREKEEEKFIKEENEKNIEEKVEKEEIVQEENRDIKRDDEIEKEIEEEIEERNIERDNIVDEEIEEEVDRTQIEERKIERDYTDQRIQENNEEISAVGYPTPEIEKEKLDKKEISEKEKIEILKRQLEDVQVLFSATSRLIDELEKEKNKIMPYAIPATTLQKYSDRFYLIKSFWTQDLQNRKRKQWNKFTKMDKEYFKNL